jgi:hypothetical protein
MIEVAMAEVGYVETPDNITKYGKAMNADGLPWCGSFINWCAKQARVDIPNVVSTIAGAKAFKAKGQWFVTPKVGDLAFFDFIEDDKSVIQHIGLVAKVGETSILTIEGNTSGTGSQANGGEVMMKTRKLGPHSFVVGYGRPSYKGAIHE